MNKKEKMLGCLGEIFGELIITAIFFGFGWLILAALGIELDAENVDFDLIILPGIGVFAAACAVIYLITRLLKRKKNTPDDSVTEADGDGTESTEEAPTEDQKDEKAEENQ